VAETAAQLGPSRDAVRVKAGADTGISKSEVSRICADLHEQVACFAVRDLYETAFACLLLDATYCKAGGGARNGRDSRVALQAIVVATWRQRRRPARGPRLHGRRQLRTVPSGPRSCTRSSPGLRRDQAVISDAHAGLKAAIAVVILGSSGKVSGEGRAAAALTGRRSRPDPRRTVVRVPVRGVLLAPRWQIRDSDALPTCPRLLANPPAGTQRMTVTGP
jgi:hypothetical protein